ncbi:hypothetical protein M408DRAFT_305789 [Serendipita vermifera MAFF 305830]|uniref:PNPLA domain-containing protein n=1 Tax=Serendipita vermifera MAFF 305830 TaxID=933852 RepID=A0A0C3ANX3_SERVB|nr:hypothetical protein M408DRAFT_305789 [Serendipita vermifera MAFF 305830]
MTSRSNLKLASFDGGGIRGLSQLEIMSNIMHRLNWDRHLNDSQPLLPYEHFDLIGGSGTGGLIAIMFAKLRMTVEEASEEFCTLIQIFEQSDITPQERTRLLKRSMEDIMKRRGVPADTRLMDPARPEGCACFVITRLRANAGIKICLRSYPTQSHPASTITLVEAVLATCAIPPLFAPIKTGPKYREKEYIGAGLGANNPIQEVIAESYSLFGQKSTVGSLLSVGGGHPGVITLPSDGDADDLYKTMRDMMNDCAEKAREIKQNIGHTGIYFRFSVEQGMQNDHASQAIDPGWIVAQTEGYLEDNVDQLDAFVKNSKQPVNPVTLDHLKSGNFRVFPAASTNVEIHNAGASFSDPILAKLRVLDLETSSPVAECMEGTRQDILSKIIDWASNMDAPNIFWLEGYPGVGKSAVAASLVEEFRKSKRLGSSFFFQRSRDNVMTTHVLWRTVAHDLACRYPAIRKSLETALTGNENLPTTFSVDTLFREVIDKPLMEYNKGPIDNPPVIIIDALDECGGLDGQRSNHRVNLMRTLKSWSKLPKIFKLIVTSRRETDITRLFGSIAHNSLEILTGRSANTKSLNDVEKYFEYHFSQIAAQYKDALPVDWPGHQVIRKLVQMANGLFIWPVTILKFLARGSPQEQLNRILDGAVTGELSTLYSWILTSSFPDPSETFTESFHSIVGTIILAKDPLPASSIGELCSVDHSMMRYIINGLQSVILSEDVPQFKHQSFVDFLLDHAKCPSPFLISLESQNRILALGCLKIMKQGLRFNICDLKSSYLRNSEITDLDLRIKEHITPHISYSAIFWASHLKDTTFDSEIFEFVHEFMHDQFLFWLEILSLTKQVNVGSSVIQSLIDWLRTVNQDDHMGRDMKKVLAAFGGMISQSVPHIYISALPLMPRGSAIREQYIGRYPRTISLLRGGDDEWSAIQNVLLGHTDWVTRVAFSPDGRRIVSGSRDRTVRVWDAETGDVVSGPFEGFFGCVSSVAFSPDGRRIVSGSRDRTVRVWDAETGDVVSGPFEGHTDYVRSVAFSPDGQRIVSGSGDMTVRVWDSETGAVVAIPFEGHTDHVLFVAFSPDGRRVVSGSRDKMVRVWDAEIGKAVAGPFKGHTSWVTFVTFSRDGKNIISGSLDMTVRVWDSRTGEVVAGPFEGHTDEIHSMEISPDGRCVVSSSGDLTFWVWDLETGKVVAGPFKGHTYSVSSVAFSPDGRRIVSCSGDQTVRVWDADIGEVIEGSFEGHTGWVTSVGFSSDGRKIFSGCRDKIVCLWDAGTGVIAGGPYKTQVSLANHFAFSPDARHIAIGLQDKTVQIRDKETGVVIAGPFEGHTSTVCSVAFSPDGRRVASGSEDMTVRVWDAKTGEVVAGPFEGHIKSIGSIAFSPDGRRIVSGSDDTTIRIWDVDTGNMIAGPFEGHAKSIESIAFSPDGRYIVSGSKDTTIRIWDVNTGNMITGPFEGHTDWVSSVAFSPDGQHIVSGAYDTMIRAWTLKAKFPLFTNSSYMIDGWMLGPNSELLFWVPPTLRSGLWRPENTVVIGKQATKLGFKHFSHGEYWTRCKDPLLASM